MQCKEDRGSKTGVSYRTGDTKSRGVVELEKKEDLEEG